MMAGLPLAAQTVPVTGRILGPDGQPLAGQNVVLHRVDASSGVTVATGVSDDAGQFRLDVPVAEAAGTGVFFLAARYTDGELYLGDAFRAPFDSATQHVVQVGTAETSARNIVSAGTEPKPADETRWLLFALPLIGILAFTTWYLVGGVRIPPRRMALAEIARLDEQNATQADPTYHARRAELLTRLGRQVRS